MHNSELFNEILRERFKENQPKDSSTVVWFVDQSSARVVISWSKVYRAMDYSLLREFDDRADQWKNLWECAVPDRGQWADLAGLGRLHFNEVVKSVIGHEMVYPDGTINYWVWIWITRQVHEMIQAITTSQ